MNRSDHEETATPGAEARDTNSEIVRIEVIQEPAETTALVVREERPGTSLPQTLFYLGLGSMLFALEGAQRVGERGVQTVAVAATATEGTAERVGQAVTGAVSGSARLTKNLAGLPFRTARRMRRAGAEALDIAEQGVAAARAGGRVAVTQLSDTGRQARQETESRVSNLLFAPLDRVLEPLVDHLAEHPQVQRLVRTQVDALLPQLKNDPEITALIETQVERLLPVLASDAQVQALIRQQADAYIQYLHDENPEVVQDLIQGQSLDLAGEVLDEVRERTVTADALVEGVVRRVLRRKPREELDPPPNVVRRQALHLRRRKTRPGQMPPPQEPAHE
jgi:hypothetical protein